MNELVKPVNPARIPTPLSGPLKQQREGTATVLIDAFEQGVMNLDEYEERIALATTASTQAELEVLTHDLPTDLVPAPSVQPDKPATLPAQRPIRAVFGNVKHKGAWLLSPSLETSAVFGNVRLDLRQVEWVENEVQINCKAVFGNIVIVVPRGVHVDCFGTGILGNFVNRASSSSTDITRRLTVTGKAIFGNVKVVRRK